MNDDHDRSSGSTAEASEGPSPVEPVGAESDLLSNVLETVRLRGSLFFLWEPGWPFATSVPDGSQVAPLLIPDADQLASYHIVLEGPCWGAVSGEAPVRLESGDILLIPRGDPYVISSEPQAPDATQAAAITAFFRLLAVGELPPVVRNGGEGPRRNRLICGFLGCDMRPFNPLLGVLPRLLRLPATASDGTPLAAMLEFAVREARQGGDGGRCVLLRLSELMFVEVIRRYLRTLPAQQHGWLKGLSDPVVGRALSLMHGSVARAWSLDALAGAVGTSRTTLAERFTLLTGEPPMQYLTRWRMQVAARALSDGHKKVYAVAREVGYESEAAFSRAFKRIVGMTPARWRAARSSGQPRASGL
ncbi:MAG: AraC family transcriptional regulator [Gammaproteobacteria bacterium]|nr:AraC family transcriptional regulator [Gammaproteobacteria bacterium]